MDKSIDKFELHYIRGDDGKDWMTWLCRDKGGTRRGVSVQGSKNMDIKELASRAIDNMTASMEELRAQP